MFIWPKDPAELGPEPPPDGAIFWGVPEEVLTDPRLVVLKVFIKFLFLMIVLFSFIYFAYYKMFLLMFSIFFLNFSSQAGKIVKLNVFV